MCNSRVYVDKTDALKSPDLEGDALLILCRGRLRAARRQPPDGNFSAVRFYYETHMSVISAAGVLQRLTTFSPLVTGEPTNHRT
jgi:hypothetical protein